VFVATSILAKHDERYMPPQLTAALKKEGEWRGDGQSPNYGAAANSAPGGGAR
jgi:cytochrome c-type biogenesis protein CcmE